MKISPANFQSYAVFIGLLVGLGFLAVFTTHSVLGLFGIVLPWYVEVPSGLGIAGALYSLYDKYFWSWPIFRTFGVTHAPDLRGRWEGEIRSSYDKHTEPVPAALEIQQSASHILVCLYTQQSRSSSRVATVERDPDQTCALHYSYMNEPSGSSLETMHTHLGSAHLRYFPDVKRLEGDYFTSRGRGTHGSMGFLHSGPKLLGRFK